MPVSKCRICGREDNRIQIRSGTGICCNICEKIDKNDLNTEERINQALDYLWTIPTDLAEQNYYKIKGMLRGTPAK